MRIRSRETTRQELAEVMEKQNMNVVGYLVQWKCMWWEKYALTNYVFTPFDSEHVEYEGTKMQSSITEGIGNLL